MKKPLTKMKLTEKQYDVIEPYLKESDFIKQDGKHIYLKTTKKDKDFYKFILDYNNSKEVKKDNIPEDYEQVYLYRPKIAKTIGTLVGALTGGGIGLMTGDYFGKVMYWATENIEHPPLCKVSGMILGAVTLGATIYTIGDYFEKKLEEDEVKKYYIISKLNEFKPPVKKR